VYVSVCVCLGKLYAVGGHDGNEHLKSGEVFDPVTNKWQSIAPMSKLRYISISLCVSVCLSVCLSVCVCVSDCVTRCVTVLVVHCDADGDFESTVVAN